MNDLKSQFDEYVATGEPPVRLNFTQVLIAAKRSRHRRRAAGITGIVAAVVAAGLVPAVLSNSPPVTAAANVCDGIDITGPAPLDWQGWTSRLTCGFDQTLTRVLPPGTQKNGEDDHSEGIWAFDDQGRTHPALRLYHRRYVITDGQGTGQVELRASPGGGSRQGGTAIYPAIGEADWTPQNGPHGEQVWVRFEQGSAGAIAIRVVTGTNDHWLEASTTNTRWDQPNPPPTPGGPVAPRLGRVTRPAPPLTEEQLITLVTDPELRY